MGLFWVAQGYGGKKPPPTLPKISSTYSAVIKRSTLLEDQKKHT